MDILFAIFLLGICLPSIYPRQVEFFRKDYTYIEQFDAFYKVHRGVSGSTWSTAMLTCDDEGAVLFYPKVEGEWTLVKNLTDKIAELPNVKEIFVGLHDEFKLGEFITVDGPKLTQALNQLIWNPQYQSSNNKTEALARVSDVNLQVNTVDFRYNDDEGTTLFSPLYPEVVTGKGYPTPSTVPSDISLLPQPNHENCMTMNVNTGLFKVSTCFRTSETALPFVCKKADDESCPTIDRGYKYAKASKKCYKVNENKVMWQEAMKTCFLEGGILAVIEDSAQAHDIRAMIASGSYFVGVRRLDYGGEFYTVKGQKFKEMYQNPYQPGQSSPYDCGTIHRYENNLYTSTFSCVERAPFVCELYV